MNPDYDRLNFPISHAFIIGIDDYKHRDISSLETAVNDAKELTKRLAFQHGYTIHGPYLNSTQAELLELLTKTMLEEVGEEDRVLFYYAGHGLARDGEDGKPKGYLIPADAGKEEKSWVSMDLLHDTIQDLPCKHGLIILDCCFSGIFKWATGTRSFTFDEPKVMYDARFQFYLDNPAWQVITSSAHDQLATDVLHNQSLGMRNEGQADHSPFADALFEALDGKGDMAPVGRPDGVITASELFVYLLEVVKDETSKYAKMQSPSLFTLPRHDKGEFIFLDPHNRLNLVDELPGNPFKGLQSYNQEDSIYFFGRDKAIQELYDVFDGNQLTVVSGASGTGKSSVIKAGLLPRLEKEGWKILPIIRPGKEPMKVIQHELHDMEEQLASGQKLVLVVDQFEELISQTIEPEEWEAFEEKLKAWLTNHDNLKIALSVRADFEPQFQGRALDPWWEKGRYRVPAFTQEEIRQVIVGPAKQAILFYEPENLVNILQTDVANAPGALPLLSFVLDQLYQERERRDPTGRNLYLEHYKELGGVLGALRQKADKLHDSLDAAQQKSMRKLMLRMVSLEGGELASRRVYKSELDFSDPQENTHIQFIEKKMDEARLIRIGNDTEFGDYIEPAHDALVRAWAKLWDWVKKVGEEKLAWQNSLTKAVGEYYGLLGNHINKKDKRIAKRKARKQLWHDDYRLDVFKHQIEEEDEHNLNKKEKKFIQKSIKKRRNKRRTTNVASIAVAVISTILVIVFYQQNSKLDKKTNEAIENANIAKANENEAKQQTYQAQIAEWEAWIQSEIAKLKKEEAEENLELANLRATISKANELAAKARQIEEQDPTIGINLAFAAYHTYQTEESFSAMRDLWNKNQLTYKQVFYEEEEISKVEFSPDGTKVIIFLRKEDVLIRDAQSGKLIQRLSTDGKSLYDGEITNDGRFIFANLFDEIKIWDLKSPSSTQTLKLKGKFAVSPDQKQILIGGNTGVGLVDIKTGEQISHFCCHPSKTIWPSTATYVANIEDIKFSPSNTMAATSGSNGNVIIWSLDSAKKIHSFGGSSGNHSPIAFSPKGRKILSVDGNQLVLRDAYSGKILRIYEGHTESIRSLAFSPDGWTIVSAGNDNTIKLWEVPANIYNDTGTYGELIKTFKGHTDAIKSVAFSPNGKHVISSSYDNTVRVWPLEEAVAKKTLKIHSTGIAYSPDGKSFITGSFTTDIVRWNIASGTTSKLFRHGRPVEALALSPNGKSLAVATDDYGSVVIKSLGQNVKSGKSLPHDTQISSLAFGPESKTIITATERQARLWDVATGNIIRTFEGHLKDVTSVVFSPDGKYVFTGSKDETAKLWDRYTGKLIRTFEGHSKDVDAVAYSPQGNFVLTGSMDDKIILWNVKTGQRIRTFEGHTGNINDIAFSSDGKRILSGSDDKTMKLWDVATGTEIISFHEHKEAVRNVAFSPDDKWALSSSKDGIAKFWDISFDWNPRIYKLNAEERKQYGIPEDVVY